MVGRQFARDGEAEAGSVRGLAADEGFEQAFKYRNFKRPFRTAWRVGGGRATAGSGRIATLRLGSSTGQFRTFDESGPDPFRSVPLRRFPQLSQRHSQGACPDGGAPDGGMRALKNLITSAFIDA